MGVVYKARHRRLQRLVALEDGAGRGARRRRRGWRGFVPRPRPSPSSRMPISCRSTRPASTKAGPIFSLELVEGGSLDQRIAESPTSPRAAAAVHRDAGAHHGGGASSAGSSIATSSRPTSCWRSSAASRRSSGTGKPIRTSLPADHWSRSTVPKIADFGLAKQVDDDSSQTQSGTILGTPSYMAPEQAGGKNREIGPAADIYSLGAILYELLVGRPPFKAGNPIDTIRQVIEQEPVPPRQLEPRVPHDLETICLKCLEKEPDTAIRHAPASWPTTCDASSTATRFTPGRRRPGNAPGSGANAGQLIVALLAVITLAALSMVLFIVWHNVVVAGQAGCRTGGRAPGATARARRARGAPAGARAARGAEALRQRPSRRGRRRLAQRSARPGEGADDDRQRSPARDR